ncbi:putative glutamine synthetase-like protein [Diaporthe ampelina]|uniref:Glutamine synthetase n=1 Tax=Diaporthe ampelina TaxID=1214573 RepID=A0A0G2F6S1_9PEZI|nr:putative glutamine synthetase-like protein [Diaporthe ampelina]
MTWATSAPAAGVSRAQLNEVIRAIHKCPIIDNHAHPLLRPEALAKYPLISITTEASGDAIHAAFTSLSHLRGVKQLAHVLDCAQTWEAVVAAIEQRRLEDYDDWISECLDGIETILVDDGLDAPDDAYTYDWHNSFTRSGCKRIVRIETVAGKIIQKHAADFKEGDNSEDVFDRAIDEFDAEIRGALEDPEVVGFKSVICYRTGLDIPAVVDLTVAKASFDEIVTDYAGPAELARIQHPGLNDLLVHRAAALISEMPGRERKPLQFHTGLGDNDLTLAKSSPAHLQEFIRTYPKVPIVLLHASYPFVLCDYVRKGAMSWKAAIELVRDILYKNSNKLYHLGLSFSEWEADYEGDAAMEEEATDLEIFTHVLRGKPTPDFIRVGWTDMTAMTRMRMIPFRKLITSLEEGKPVDIGITKACLGLLQHDWMSPGTNASGEYRLHPDFSSLKAGPIPGHFSMYGDFREKDGSTVPLCPRTQLTRAQEHGARQGLAFLVGFEIEFLLLHRSESGKFEPLASDGHSWSVSRFWSDQKIPKLLAEIVRALESMDILVEQVHAESAPGQFELVLPPLAPVQAVDTLLHAREVISAMATAAGFKFTLYPKPFPDACGTAAHAHISISSAGGDKKETYEPFYAGVLKHLRAIAAFAYSNPASYERLADGVWAGGRWVTWGTQNREAPLRKIEGSHWEFKCLDGLANPYLALASVLFAGTSGFTAKEKLVWQDCEVDPAILTENDRKELNVSEMLPASVEEALEALEKDEGLVGLIGSELVEKYSAVKQFELKFLESMQDEERRQFLIARY